MSGMNIFKQLIPAKHVYGGSLKSRTGDAVILNHIHAFVEFTFFIVYS